MARRLILEFTKMNGAGNDFIVIDNRFYHFSDRELAGIARHYCRRRFGVGADGLLALSVPTDPDHDYRMRYLNSDGSIGTMCGNGARCLARFARQSGINRDDMVFESDAGLYRVHAPANPHDPVRLFVQPPKQFEPDKKLKSPIAAEVGPLHYIWTGVEHLVCFVPNVAQAPVAEWGPQLRRDEALGSAGANVNFVEIVENAEERAGIRVRTFEKGVEEETLACGTGAMAAAVVSRLLDQIRSTQVSVDMPGGTLGVGFRLVDDTVQDLYLEGPAESVYRGSLELKSGILD